MYSNNVLNFPETTTILNPGSKNSGNLLKVLRKIAHVFAGTFAKKEISYPS